MKGFVKGMALGMVAGAAADMALRTAKANGPKPARPCRPSRMWWTMPPPPSSTPWGGKDAAPSPAGRARPPGFWASAGAGKKSGGIWRIFS